MIELYGIPNCDTVKKARTWLTDNHIEYQFQDFKKITVTAEMLQTWIKELGLELIINKRGTTWRKLSDEDKAKCAQVDSAIEILLNNLSMIKRPLLVQNGQATLIGFSVDDWAKHFA